MPMILFLNIKGGVAKTTTLVAVAEALAVQKHRVLVIDADHQAGASDLLLGGDRLEVAEKSRKTLHDLLSRMFADDFEPADVQKYVHVSASNVEPASEHVAVIPGSLRLEDFGAKLLQAQINLGDALYRRRKAGGMGAIKQWAEESGYEYVLVDCPPSVSPQVELFLRACDSYVVPCIPDWLSVRGVLWLQTRLQKMGIKQPALGIAWTLYRNQVHTHVETMEEARGRKGHFRRLPAPFENAIPNATAVVDATTQGRDGTRFASYGEKYGAFSHAFRELATEITERAAKVR
jgi:chromosome partitioning protein